jgi:hypothetical protein
MARAKKTVDLTALIDEVNRRNRESSCSPEARMGWNMLLEGFLHANDAYAGFGFLEAKSLTGPAKGQAPGYVPDPDGNHGPDGKHSFPDESRRVYYTHHTLKPSKRGFAAV